MIDFQYVNLMINQLAQLTYAHRTLIVHIQSSFMTLFQSIFKLKCPRCRTGDLFDTGSFSFQQPFEMPDECPVCGQKYLPEPGFYYGSMFISYIFTSFFCLGFIFFFHWGLGWSTGASFALLIAVCAVFFVYIFRLARSLWIHINVKYRPELMKK